MPGCTCTPGQRPASDPASAGPARLPKAPLPPLAGGVVVVALTARAASPSQGCCSCSSGRRLGVCTSRTRSAAWTRCTHSSLTCSRRSSPWACLSRPTPPSSSKTRLATFSTSWRTSGGRGPGGMGWASLTPPERGSTHLAPRPPQDPTSQSPTAPAPCSVLPAPSLPPLSYPRLIVPIGLSSAENGARWAGWRQLGVCVGSQTA